MTFMTTVRWGALSLMALAILFGCGSLVASESRVDWNPLSKDGCPNLSGRYRNLMNGTNDLFFFDYLEDSVIVKPLYGNNPQHYVIHAQKRSDPPLRDYWTLRRQYSVSVDHVGENLIVGLLNEHGELHAELTIDLRSAMTGCRDAALILRQENRDLGSEGAGSSFSWSETEIRKLPDGSLEISRRGGKQSYGGLTGLPIRGRMQSPVDAPRGETFRVLPLVP